MKKKTVSVIMLTLLMLSILPLAFDIESVRAEPTTWTVDDDGPADFNTIQAAINVAKPQDTIYVYNGTYYENIVIKKTLSFFGQNRTNTIIDGSGGQWTVEVYANNVTISGFTIRNGGKNMKYKIIPNGGVKLSSNNSLLHGNMVVDNDYSGVWTGYFELTSGNTIQNNVIENNLLGIVTSYGSNNTVVIENKVLNNDFGVHITSSRNFLRNNMMNNNQHNLGVYGQFASDFIQDIDTSNMVDGKPVYYLVYENNRQVPPNAGFVAAISSRNIVVGDATIKNIGTGVLFVNTTSSVINNVTAINCWFSGIYLLDSHYNKITNSTLVRPKGYQRYGLGLRDSNDNTIKQNFISIRTTGMDLYNSSSNILIENTITNNYHALSLTYSNWNKVYHNNFINNTIQVPVGAIKEVNVWDNGYPSGGNYWSDYTDVDEKSGPGQDLSGSDGIWDHSYIIDANNQDNYPLIEPWSTKPLSPVEATQELIETIEIWNLPQGVENSLTSKLYNVIHMLDEANEKGATHKLMVFTNQVKALEEKKLAIIQADYLLAEAERIIDLIK